MSHSTKKPWRQKGTGRARAGMTSSPLWRGGGRIFPNRPDENFTQKLNRKMYRAGVCSILSQLAREGRLSVVDSFTLDAPKTKLLAQKVKGMGYENVLIVTDSMDENLLLVVAQPAERQRLRGRARRPGEPDPPRQRALDQDRDGQIRGAA